MSTSHANHVPVSSSPSPARSPSPLLWPAGQCCHGLLCWPRWALVQKHGQSALGSCLAVRRPATISSLNGVAAPRPARPGRRGGREAPGVAPAYQLSPSFSSLLPQERNRLWPRLASPQRGPDPLQATVGLLRAPARRCPHQAANLTDKKVASVSLPRSPCCTQPQPHQGTASPWQAGLTCLVCLGTAIVTVSLPQTVFRPSPTSWPICKIYSQLSLGEQPPAWGSPALPPAGPPSRPS